MKSVEERFWAHVERQPGDGCWIWRGYRNWKGYGVFQAGAHPGMAHRYAYELLIGPIPAGLLSDHVCHQPTSCAGGNSCPHRACCNPTHIELVTPAVNVSAQRSCGAPTKHPEVCPQGHAYTPENTYVRKTGARDCRMCKRDSLLRWRAKGVPPPSRRRAA